MRLHSAARRACYNSIVSDALMRRLFFGDGADVPAPSVATPLVAARVEITVGETQRRPRTRCGRTCW